MWKFIRKYVCTFWFSFSHLPCYSIYRRNISPWEYNQVCFLTMFKTEQYLVFKQFIFKCAHVKIRLIMEFFRSVKGARKLKYGEYVYCKNKSFENGNTYWECSERRSGQGCRVKLLLDEGENLLKQSGEHTHAPNPDRVKAEIIRSNMKREARISNARTNTIVAANIGVAEESVMANLPKAETMLRDVRRQRQIHNNMPEIPQRDDTMFNIPHQYTITQNNKQFLWYDNQREDRILIFGIEESLNYLNNSEHWFMDGTFATAPPQFLQLYTVHGLNHGRNVVGAYCLLPNKRTQTYTEMLNEICRITDVQNIGSIMIDFEPSMIQALENVFPGVPVKGCLFHLCKSIFRRVQSEGLVEQYTNNEEFRTAIRMTGAISFVPVADTIQAFESLSEFAIEPAQVILDYFETNYVGELRRGRRLEPRFPHAMWNMNARVLNNIARTNNDLEGWHNRFSGNFHGNHENIWKFINVLKSDSSLNHHKMAQVLIGAPVPPQKPRYRAINERLQNLVGNYNNNDILTFLRGISYNLP